MLGQVSMIRRFLIAVTAVTALGACGTPPATAERPTFDVGEADDPIVQAQALDVTTDTVTVTVKNTTSYPFTQGLILFSAPFTVGSVASTAFTKFVSGSSSTRGDANALATGLGLSVGTTAFIVPGVAKNGGSQTVTIQVPAGSKVTYVARVDTSIDDFVAAVNVALTGSAPGAISGLLQGYDLQNPSVVGLGNGTTGQTLSSTAFTLNNLSDCPGGAATVGARLFEDDFAQGAGSTAWPTGFGWDGEFNGDWYTDGVTVRVYNPNWGGAQAGAPIPTVTGFWKRLDVCPATGSLMQADAKVATQLTDSTSDTTLVVYFFDRAGALISVTTNWPLYAQNDRTTAIHDAVIPTGTRRIVVAPMMRLGLNEQGDVFYDHVSVDYEPATAYTNTTLASDDFSQSSGGQYGSNQPKGWAEFGGDWYRMTSQNWATLGNPSWAGGATNVDTGLVKAFSFTSFGANDFLNAKVFAAATFTDPTSFVRLRVVFSDGTALESQRQVRGWGALEVRRQAIPAGATSAQVIVNAYLGPKETSSLYVDDFSLVKTHKN